VLTAEWRGWLLTTNGKKIRAGRGRAGEPAYMEVEMAHHTTALLEEGLTMVSFTENRLVLYGENQQYQAGQLGPAVSGGAVRVDWRGQCGGLEGLGLGSRAWWVGARRASLAWVYVSAGAATLGP
jgi:hypothetical protein